MLVFVVIAGASFNFYVHTYKLSDEEFDQYLLSLSFPMTLLQKFMRFEHSGLQYTGPHNPKIGRISMAVIVLLIIVPFLAINFIRTPDDEKIYQIILWGIYIFVFINSWQVGSGMRHFKVSSF